MLKLNVENNLEEKPYSASALHSSRVVTVKDFIKAVLKKVSLVWTLNKHLKKMNGVKASNCYAYFNDENISPFLVILLLNLRLENWKHKKDVLNV